jgi:hypothetical protein
MPVEGQLKKSEDLKSGYGCGGGIFRELRKGDIRLWNSVPEDW